MHVYVTRHGESYDNAAGRIGGDSGLTPRGVAYAEALPEMLGRGGGDIDLVVSSSLRRARETAARIPAAHHTHTSALDEIWAGDCDGMSVEEADRACPGRARDKLRFRYPGGGESYEDLRARVEPALRSILKRSPPRLAVVAHKAVLRVVFALLEGRPVDPHEAVPLGRVYHYRHKGQGRYERSAETQEDEGASA